MRDANEYEKTTTKSEGEKKTVKMTKSGTVFYCTWDYLVAQLRLGIYTKGGHWLGYV